MMTSEELLMNTCPSVNRNEILGRLGGQAHDEVGAKTFIRRCLGAGRLLGEDLAEALCQVQENLRTKQENISLLAVLTRSHVVVADAIDDGVWEDDVTVFLDQWKQNLRAQIIDTLAIIDDSQDDKYKIIFADAERTSREAYESFDYSNPLQGVRNKLAIFFLSLRIPELEADSEKAQKIDEFLHHYLFTLQLIDDIVDMEEDFSAAKNHNLFVGQSAEDDYQLMLSRRKRIFADLLRYIRENLQKFQKESLFQGNLFGSYLQGIFHWIEMQRRNINIDPIVILPQHYQEHNLPLSTEAFAEDASTQDEQSELPPHVSAPDAHRTLQDFLRDN